MTKTEEALEKIVANVDILAMDRTYACPICLDTAYTSRKDRHGNSLARPCECCVLGVCVEAGLWVRRLGKRPTSDVLDAFRARQRSHPNGIILRDKTDALMRKPVEA